MEFSQAAEDLLRAVRSRSQYNNAFIKKYWKKKALPREQEEELITQILSVGRRVTEKIHFLKWLVYLHVIVVSRIQFFRLLTQEILQYNTSTFQVKKNSEELIDQVISVYLLYIQRRILKVGVIRNSPKKSNKDQHLQVSFLILNLIKLGCNSCKQIYKFGIKYSYKYPFLSNLNTIIGMDLTECYNTLRSNFCWIWGRFANYELQTKHLLNALVDEISATNQMLYIVFYNAYFYTELKDYLPDWINFQPIEVQDSESDQTIYEETQRKDNQFFIPLTNQRMVQLEEPPSPTKKRPSLVRPKQTEISIQQMQKLMNETSLQNSNETNANIKGINIRKQEKAKSQASTKGRSSNEFSI